MSHSGHLENSGHSHDETGYITPYKAILSPADLETWKQSATHQSMVDYIAQLNTSIVGKKLTDTIPESEVSCLTCVLWSQKPNWNIDLGRPFAHKHSGTS